MGGLKWNDRAGDMVFVFVANYITGQEKHVLVRNDYRVVEAALDKLSRELGFYSCVWATYDARNPEAACVVDFNNYVSFHLEDAV